MRHLGGVGNPENASGPVVAADKHTERRLLHKTAREPSSQQQAVDAARVEMVG